MMFVEKFPRPRGFNFILMAILASQLMSCVEVRDNKKKAEDTPPPVHVASADSQASETPETDPDLENSESKDVKFDLREGSIPHQYQLLIKWPQFLKKVVVENKGETIFETDSAPSYTHAFKDNVNIFVRVFSYDEDRPILIGEYKERTPKDFTFSSMELKENFSVEANRIYLPSGVRIQTNGYDFDVRALSLFSDEAEVFSFQSAQKAGALQNGRRGGTVSIQSQKALGLLRIRLTGENGGDGINGAPHAGRAASGAGGVSGAHECYTVPPFGPTLCRCTRQPTNGEPGAPGAIGNPGLPAGSGGASGAIYVQVAEGYGFTAETSLVAGRAGVPGLGGEGQWGGLGGPGGNPTSASCNGSFPGPDQPQAARGSDAPASADGGIETNCVSIDQEALNCRKR